MQSKYLNLEYLKMERPIMQYTKFLSYDSRKSGMISPSFAPNPKLIDAGLKSLRSWGYDTILDHRAKNKYRYFAGTDKDRAAAIHAMVRNRNVGTIWCARGGYGTTRLLPHLDKLGTGKAMKTDPKLLIGFSDITALHFYFWQRARTPSLHGPMPGTGLWEKMSFQTQSLMQAAIAGFLPVGKESHSLEWKTKFLTKPKRAEGIVLGGNLSMLATLAGTPWQPDLSGALLFLEDCGENPYRVDRMLCQLENAKMLKGIRGVLLGDFETDVVYRSPKEKKYWKEIFLERFSVPVLTNLPCGHADRNEPLPLGVSAEILLDGKLRYLEQPVLGR